ncbi:MAG: DNA-binding protein [Chloroflexota bacterium]|nr:MAG: DNA-binding protein [Chloroflexota bacterium]
MPHSAHPDTTPTTEEYLEIIYMMAAEDRIVKGARLAEIIGVSRPTVTATLRRMLRDDLIALDAKKQITLTSKGYAIADMLQRRHRIIERWLTDTLGLDWAESDAESHRLEHAFSDQVVERLNELLGFPETCPHGNPIPGNQRGEPGAAAFPLSQASEGATLLVARISEYVENSGDMLKHLGERGLVPGAQITVVEHSPLNQALTLRVNDKYFALALYIANALWVTKG